MDETERSIIQSDLWDCLDSIEDAIDKIESIITKINKRTGGRETALAHTKLEEARMWTNQANDLYKTIAQ
jgi:hypothetical protein